MICNKCGQEMPEVGEFCPFCAEPKPVEEAIPAEEILQESEVIEETESTEVQEQPEVQEEVQEEAPKSKLKRWHIVAIVAGGLVLLAVLALAILYGMGVDLKPRENDVYFKDSYTAENETIEKKSDQVIATLGDRELTNGELQLYYMNYIYTFYSQNYSYLAYYGLDMTLPLDEQKLPQEDPEQTWQQYFLEKALTDWQAYAILDMLVEEEGYTASADMQALLDEMPAEIASIAQSYGYEDVDSYLAEMMAPGVSEEEYVRFNAWYYVGNEYLDGCYVSLYPTQEEIDAYYEENIATFMASGLAPGMGLNSAVRHILIQPEGVTADENGQIVYTEEEWAAAYAEAERILEEWKSGDATEESFGALANTYSGDGGSNNNGGLYQDVNIDASYVEEFRAWAVDENRRPGDTGIVKTQFGYHIMYFISGEDYFSYVVGQQLVAERIQEKLVAVRDAYPMEVNYKKILLFTPSFG